MTLYPQLSDMENSRDKNGLKEQNNSNEPTHTQGHNGDVPPLYTESVASVPSSSSTSANAKKDKINRIDNVFVNFCAKPNKKLKNDHIIDDYCMNSFKKYCTLACKYNRERHYNEMHLIRTPCSIQLLNC